ncbi:4'-phosphopantetheinyl transferase family protein [Nonomuraea aridisoli]|uniref:4'-phosphopantetheinyl transferase n=1 Tax=Nonomuraea aridisoli TaxID=2070368 RepID=A0A2W2G2B1_9ACTN|nr:4'-phosphopantetheinyl transferase superfamily protein [Nonomuraea aridisoli]PZG21034.1 4'-phosphopantetheinyl transferase [Nonomuraea aridisoli]
MIDEILPDAVVAVEAFGDVPGTRLFPEEEALIAGAAPRRRREFATVRACARAALAGLGLPPVPVLPGPGRAPAWPPGVVGSMSHCDGYRVCAVSRATDMWTIGVDAEPNDPLPPDVLGLVADRGERAWIAGLAAQDPEVCWDRLLFSAKESVYKAWFPLTGRFLDFSEATLTVDPCERTFSASLAPGRTRDGGLVTGFTGRWLVRGGLVLTATAVPRDCGQSGRSL